MFDYIPVRFHTFARYVVCGGTSTAIHYAILTALVELAGVDETLSTTAGYFSSAIVNYQMLYRWAFRSQAGHGRASRRYLLTVSTSLLLNSLVFWVLLETVGLWYLPAQVITTVLVLSFSFTVNSRYTFTHK